MKLTIRAMTVVVMVLTGILLAALHKAARDPATAVPVEELDRRDFPSGRYRAMRLLAANLGSQGYRLDGRDPVTADTLAAAISGFRHLVCPDEEYRVEWRLNAVEGPSFVKVQHETLGSYNDEIYDRLSREWLQTTLTGGSTPGLLASGTDLIARASVVHERGRAGQDVSEILEQLREQGHAIEFRSDEIGAGLPWAYRKWEISIAKTAGDYRLQLDVIDSTDTGDGPWCRVVLQFDFLESKVHDSSDHP